MTRDVLVQGASRGLGLAFVERLAQREDVGRVFATCRAPDASEALARLRDDVGRGRIRPIRLDVEDEASIEAAAVAVRRETSRLHLVLNCAGLLHEGAALQPEKRLEAADPTLLRRSFDVNAIGPLLVAKHFYALLRHDDRAVLANVSARVGSIGDNHAGGWYGYRASKAAQNMFTRTTALELRRRAPNVICVALHPGTVDTDLSRPFQRNVPPERLFDAKRAADQLLAVIDGLTPAQSGTFLAWDGQAIPW